MQYRILADEHVEPATRDYLKKLGHSVEFVVDIDDLGESTPDDEIASYSFENELLILTYDDDFLTTIDPSDTGGVLYLEDDELSGRQIGEIVNEISTDIAQDDIVLEYVSRNWL